METLESCSNSDPSKALHHRPAWCSTGVAEAHAHLPSRLAGWIGRCNRSRVAARGVLAILRPSRLIACFPAPAWLPRRHESHAPTALGLALQQSSGAVGLELLQLRCRPHFAPVPRWHCGACPRLWPQAPRDPSHQRRCIALASPLWLICL